MLQRRIRNLQCPKRSWRVHCVYGIAGCPDLQQRTPLTASTLQAALPPVTRRDKAPDLEALVAQKEQPEANWKQYTPREQCIILARLALWVSPPHLRLQDCLQHHGLGMKAWVRNAVAMSGARRPRPDQTERRIDRMGAAIESDEDALGSRHMRLASRRRKKWSSKSRRRRKMGRRSPIADDDVVQPPPVGRNHQVDFPAISAPTLADIHYAALSAVFVTKRRFCVREYFREYFTENHGLHHPMLPVSPCPLSEQYTRWRSE